MYIASQFMPLIYLLILPLFVLADFHASAQPSNNAEVLLKTAQALINNDPAKAREVHKQAIKAFEQERYSDTFSLQLLLFNGRYYNRLSQYDSSILICDQVYKKAIKVDAFKIAAEASAQKGIAYEMLGQYRLAAIAYFEAYRIYESTKFALGVMNQSLNLGLIYQIQKKYKIAESYFNKARILADSINDQQGYIASINNLGINYTELKQYPQALKYFSLVLDFDLKSGDSINIADSYNNVGVSYLLLKEYNKAILFLNKSAGIKKRIDNIKGYANTINNLAEAYIYVNTERVLPMLDEALSIAKKYTLLDVRAENFRIRHIYYNQIGNYKLAYEAIKLMHAYNDSLRLNELNLEIDQLNKQSEWQKSIAEINDKNNKLQQEIFSQRLTATILAGLVLVFMLFLINYYRIKKLNQKLHLQQEQILFQNKELIQRNFETAKAQKEAESAAIAKTRFLSVMSHEIRTPLNAIIGLANLLNEEQSEKEKVKENLRILKSSSDHLLALLNDVLDLTRIESGKMPVQQIPFNLKEVLTQIIELYEFKSKEKNINLSLTWDSLLPEVITGDQLHLNQILSNLVSNAIKFTNNGSVTIAVKQNGYRNGVYAITFSVLDTGIGISHEDINKIFNPFEQADSRTTRIYGGTGLGLAISKRLLEHMGSTLKLESEPGKGSVFSFELQLAESSQILHLSTIKKPENEASGLKGKRILLAEDNQINVHVIKQFLLKWGVEITVANNGKEAVEAYNNQIFDLVLMDLHMPIMDGYDAASIIIKQHPDARILAITAAEKSEVKEKITAIGMCGYVMKPFQPNDLLYNLLQALNRNSL